MIDLSLRPHRAGLPAGDAVTLDVLLRITPAADLNDVVPRRPPLNLAKRDVQNRFRNQ